MVMRPQPPRERRGAARDPVAGGGVVSRFSSGLRIAKGYPSFPDGETDVSHRKTDLVLLVLAATLLWLPLAWGGVQGPAAAGVESAPIFASDLPAGARPEPPAVPEGTMQFVHDDGSIDSAYGVFRIPTYDRTLAGLWLNRFTVGHGVQIDSISIFWPPAAANIEPGYQLLLVAYYDADMDGDPSNAVRLGTDKLVTISALSQWQTWPVDFTVPGNGDLYVGFVDMWARVQGGLPPPLKYAASADEDDPKCRSYMIHQVVDTTLVDYEDINGNAVIDIVHSASTGQLDNLMIRASGTPLAGDQVFTHGFDDVIPCTVIWNR